MQQLDKISGYIRTVCEQIRWKKAHGLVSEEIENHLMDQRDAFIAEGMDEETATDEAIKEMEFYSLSLPLISPGGTAAVVNMTLIGIMLSVFKSGYLVRDNTSTSTLQKAKLFEMTDGKIIIYLNTK